MARWDKRDSVELEGDVVASTPRALRFKPHEADNVEWVPRSQVEVIDRGVDGTYVVLRMPYELAKEKGWN